MKKLLSVLLVLAVIFAFGVTPASAETNSSEWKKGSGPAKIDFSDVGTKIILNEGLQFYYYQKPVNLRDFTVKVKFNMPSDASGGYFAMTLGGNGKYNNAGGAQNFIIFWVRGAESICVNPQILHNGQGGIKPESKMLYQDILTKDTTLHFVKVNDVTYSITVNDEWTFEYCIPENFNFVEDVNGEGCISFGGSVSEGEIDEHGEGAFNVLVKEINGVKMNGKNEPVSSNTSSGENTTDTDTPDTSINTEVIGGSENDANNTTETTDDTKEGNGILIVIIAILGGLLLISIVFNIILIIIINNKKARQDSEEAVEEAVEE